MQVAVQFTHMEALTHCVGKLVVGMVYGGRVRWSKQLFGNGPL